MSDSAMPINAGTQIHKTQLSTTYLTGSTLRLARIIWFAVTIFTLVLCVIGYQPTLNAYLRDSQQYKFLLDYFNLPADLYAIYQIAMSSILLIVFTVIAIIVFWRNSTNWMALLLSISILAIGARNTDFPLGVRDLTQSFSVGSLAFMAFSIIGYAAVVMLLFFFPDGRFGPAWGRYVNAVWLPYLIVAHGLAMVNRSRAQFYEPLLPFAIPIALSVIYAQVVRYRRLSDTVQRQQIKWVIFGLGLGLACVLVYRLGNAFLPRITGNPDIVFAFSLVTRPIYMIGLIAIPITVTLAILRYRLFDIDLIISRSLVFALLTVVLGTLFAGLVLILQRVIQSSVAIAFSALLIGIMFQPIRRRLQRFVNRRFYGIEIDLDQFNRARMFDGKSRVKGRQLGVYILEDSIGRGGMAEVYKARHMTLSRPVAIKLLPADRAEEGNFRKRFEHEARTAAALHHPNIVQVFDFGETQGTYYMVMEYIAGQDLSAYLAQHKKLTFEEAIPIMRDVAAALDFAHAQGVIHRDVKPSNVMLRPITGMTLHDAAYRAVLMDFGIARIITGTTGATQTGTIGTLDYMSPEQITASMNIDPRADVYSFAVMLYEMLTGSLPFTGSNPGAMVLAHMQQIPKNPCDLNPDLPPIVGTSILVALAKSPDDRFDTAGELLRAMNI